RNLRQTGFADGFESGAGAAHELATRFAARDDEVGLLGFPADSLGRVQMLDLVPLEPLKHSGVDFLEAVVGLDPQLQPRGNRLCRLHRAAQRAGYDRVDWEVG